MPKQVDAQERRERIASALLHVAADEGLEAVSLRSVAAAAGVTSGMVQHYFPSKEAMVDFAMASAGARFEARMGAAAASVGPDATPRELVGAMVSVLLPRDATERADARVGLAFLSHAAGRAAAAERLGEGNSQLRAFLADQIRRAQAAGTSAGDLDPDLTGAVLLALAEGLGVHVVATGLPVGEALAALDAHLDRVLGPPRH